MLCLCDLRKEGNRVHMKYQPVLSGYSRVCATVFTVMVMFLCSLSGCGGGSRPPADSTEQTKSVVDEQADGQSDTTTDSPPNASTREKTPLASQDSGQIVRAKVDANGQKWIDNVPVDVWFPDPLKVAGNQQVVVIAPDKTSTTPSNPTGSTAPKPEPKPSGTANWPSLISAEVLESEVKQIRNRLTDKLRTVGSYNSGYLELPPHLATLTVLAAVAIEHPGDIRWKENAKYVRDLSAGMNAEKMVRGAKSYRKIQTPYESIITIFNGSKPATLENAEDATDFSEVADFGYLMKRLDIGSKWLKVNAGSESNFKEKPEEILSEAGVSAVIGKVITMEGYGYADDQEFLGYAKKLVDGARQMTAAAKSGDFASYDTGLNMVYQSCTECHGVYR